MSIAFLFDMYQRVVETLLPPDSRRRHYCQLVRDGIRGIWNEGWRSCWYRFTAWLRQRSMLLNEGRIVIMGDTEKVVNNYLALL